MLAACSTEAHIVPLDDLRPHDLTPQCWCQPAEDDECMAHIHRSLDGRERFERGERLPS